MFDPVHGKDYLKDYYAILGVEKDADDEELKKIIKKERAGNHPDRLVHLSDELKQTARQRYTLVNEAADVLLDKKKRAVYNVLFEKFLKATPQLISKQGHAIVDLSRRTINFSLITSGDVLDVSEKIAQLEQFTSYDEKKFEKMQSLYRADSSNEIVKDLYYGALEDKLVYLNLREELAWGQAGILNNKNPVTKILGYPDEYPGKVLDAINAVGLEIQKEVSSICYQSLPGNKSLLLLAANPLDMQSGKLSVLSKKAIKTFSIEMKEKFFLRTEEIKKLSEEKQKVLEELVELTKYEYLFQNQTHTKVCDIYVYVEKDDRVLFKLAADTHILKITDTKIFQEKLSLTELKSQTFSVDTILVYHNPEIEFWMLEAIRIFGKHMERFEEK